MSSAGDKMYMKVYVQKFIILTKYTTLLFITFLFKAMLGGKIIYTIFGSINRDLTFYSKL